MLQRKPLKIWNVNVDNIVFSKLVKTKANSKYLMGYSDKALRLLILIMPTISGYVKTFKGKKDGNKDKNNILMSFRPDDEKLLVNIKLLGLRLKI